MSRAQGSGGKGSRWGKGVPVGQGWGSPGAASPLGAGRCRQSPPGGRALLLGGRLLLVGRAVQGEVDHLHLPPAFGGVLALGAHRVHGGGCGGKGLRLRSGGRRQPRLQGRLPAPPAAFLAHPREEPRSPKAPRHRGFGEKEVAEKGWAAVPSIPLKAAGWHSSWLSFLGLMGHQEPSSMNWISSQSVQEFRISMNNL